MSERWQIWIDRGGTFTDCIGRGPDGVRVVKVLSSDRAPLLGIRRLMGLAEDAPIAPCDVRMGTTLATNALLERKGVATALVISRGFGDVLEIGDQSRPDIFALSIDKPSVLYREVVEIPARVDAQGRVLEAPSPGSTKRALARLREGGIRSLAVVLMHAYKAAAQERQVGGWAREVGFEHVSLSHEVAAEIGLLARGDTTVVDAYLTPLVGDYLRQLMRELPGSTLQLMQSSGGLCDASGLRGHHAILSGPAGGVVASARVARDQRVGEVIGLDMGGTSTDVSRYGGELERVYETRVAGVRLRAPMMDIHTVAAGGGSICRFDGHRFTVGPDSAGAQPGPLCYGQPAARELALTDINLVLGRLTDDRFPFTLERERVMEALEGIAARLTRQGDERGALDVAQGFYEIAVERMAEAIRKVSIARGHDPRTHALVVFGGAAAQHACGIARRLGIGTIILHPYAGVLSAYGIGLADVSWHGEQDAERLPLGDPAQQALAERLYRDLEADGRRHLQGDDVRVIRRVDLRYRGTETSLTLPAAQPAELRAAFEALHQGRFGYVREEHPIEVVTVRVELVAPSPGAVPARPPAAEPSVPLRSHRMWLDGGFRQVPVYGREQLWRGARLDGPCLILEDTATIAVDEGFRLAIDDDGVITLRDVAAPAAVRQVSARCDPVQLEIFNHLYMTIAEQMGVVLQRTALSTNIRERLDFSCAVFDARGALVANAPHIPVHLGAMSETIRGVLSLHPSPEPGDVFASNDPHLGGSHLPDITVITPVFREGRLVFFTANRGHHADVGGLSPGSMPPFSRRLEQEGVVLRAERIVRGGRLDEARLRRVLGGGPHPARNVDENLADLEAQIAADQLGARLLMQLVDKYGLDVAQAYVAHVQDNAEAMVREAIRALPDGLHRFSDRMDDGTCIQVAVQIDGDRMCVDFAGTDPEVDGNGNAPRAVTVAAVLYVLRCLVGKPIPLNSGCLRPVQLQIPEGSLLCPSPGAAVVAGNVETSQRVVDVLLAALGKLAASQGTMNNLTFGDEHFGYYETIAGGAGAGETFDGASGVHTHMTNTRITDPEVLEARFPVRLRRFAKRPGTGGAGTHHGGDGLIREFEALAPLTVSILSERRRRPPFGLRGGGPGAAGRNTHNGEELPGRTQFEVSTGDRFCIETPGGGGFGA